MTTMIQRLRSSMAFNIIGAIVLLLVLLGVIVSTFGYIGFSDAISREYSITTYHIANTATTLVNGDHIDEYLKGEETEEYQTTKRYLDAYCHKMSVSLVYVISVDRSDYGRFVSVFNSVYNEVDQSTYTEWELGHKRDTTNNEYKMKYQALYGKSARYETVFRRNPSDGSHPHITTMVPVMDAKGDVAALLCVQRPIREMRNATRPYLIKTAISTILLSVAAGILAAAFIRNQFVAPIRRVSDEATRFARENTKGTPLGQISSYTVLANLAGSIDTMETDMLNYVSNLTAATAERERIGTELSLASGIQKYSVPNNFPAFPDRGEFDIYASMFPAKEVGGDFYNFFLIDEEHLAFVIGDVSGKGIPGALFMMVTNILLTDRTRMGGTPGEILTFVNDNICEHNEMDMFVTVWLGILEIPTGKVTFANAGHDDAALCRKSGLFELFVTKHSLVIGAMPGIQYRNFEIQLGAGDKLFLYTDGIPEATDVGNRMFTTGRMLDVLNEYREKEPQEILAHIHESVDAFAGEAPQFDDVTMLCLELKEAGVTREDLQNGNDLPSSGSQV